MSYLAPYFVPTTLGSGMLTRLGSAVIQCVDGVMDLCGAVKIHLVRLLYQSLQLQHPLQCGHHPFVNLFKRRVEA